MNSSDLPKISLRKLIAKDAEELTRLKSCMLELGFFKLVDHGLDPTVRNNSKINSCFFTVYSSWYTVKFGFPRIGTMHWVSSTFVK